MQEKQYTKYTVDFRDVTNFFEMHAAILEGLEFPDYYGCNWDAFWDCLKDMFGKSIQIEILGVDIIERLFNESTSMMLSTLKEWKEFESEYRDIRIEIIRDGERIEIDDYPIR